MHVIRLVFMLVLFNTFAFALEGTMLPSTKSTVQISVSLFDHPLRELVEASSTANCDFKLSGEKSKIVLEWLAANSKQVDREQHLFREIGRLEVELTTGVSETIRIYWTGGKGPLVFTYKGSVFVQTQWKGNRDATYSDGAISFDQFLRKLDAK